MNRKERRLQAKAAKKSGKKTNHHGILGEQLAHQGRVEEAIEAFQKALQLDPKYADGHFNLGVLFRGQGKLDDAIQSYQRAIAIKPGHFDACYNLGNALKEKGMSSEAITAFQKAVSIKPNFAEAHNNLGNALRELKRLEEAAVSYQNALAVKPDYVDAQNNLGITCCEMGKIDEAVAIYQDILASNPGSAEVHNNLGNALRDQRQLDEAVACFNRALHISPGYVDALNNLGNALRDLGQLDQALASYKKSIAINPDLAEAHNNLGNVQQDLGNLDDTLASYRKALELSPSSADTHSNLLLAEQYRLGHNAETLYQLHSRWDEQHGKTLRAQWPEHQNTTDPDRRLRIGFVSPDLGRHPVGYFAVRLLENLPKEEIKTIVYSDCIADDLSERNRAAVGSWRDIRWESDENLTTTILNDEIDILIDLTGHSANNRLLVFARKPAPLQVSWAGYVGTTGLSAIDYYLSDQYSTLADEEQYYSESILRMPDGWLCYDPPDYAPKVGTSPFRKNDGVTFGSFSNPAKINQQVVSVWSRILDGAAHSHLLIKYKGIDSSANIERLTAMFMAEGIDSSRLTLEGPSPHEALFARYNDVDIALDPFPYSGGLTTYEALWMGVPVITVPGQTFASRHSLSHLSTIGLPELIARDHDDYVRLAVGLANDGDRLEGLRAGLREKMDASHLCNGEKFAQAFATQMRDIWRLWCASR
ncbi:MAG: tetratricopeptide repeat protein [Rhodospirillaceae bacterium]|jgi:protein O-GlcNAc transferase|nr:tetratricopeptide repeat protein [Rhodospirillaceae bacterium]MBT5245538.1 tetratricopeptide repeat protein [Rhodospirillaceae bacterium]MBT5561020.1 tetratricopeptide repeat protein [Rhodospirillaceae bacterium]MBT6240656.1 tetratricopeptide repeat protein [Rhodospirillaceae bacterium]